MANDPKFTGVYGVRLKLESSYLGGGSLAATDAIMLEEDFDIDVQESHSGERPGSPGSGSPRRKLKPSGLFVDGPPLTIAARGAGAAYDDSPLVVPPDVYVAMRMAGYNAAIDTTSSAEKVTFTPTSGPPVGGSFASAVGEFYSTMQMIKLKGILADLNASMKDSGPLLKMFPFKGVVDTNWADAQVPTMTYFDETLDPPKCDSVVCTITPSGGSAFTSKLRDFQFKGGRSSSGPRSNRNANGHSGFAQGVDRVPEFTTTIEQVDAATFDPEAAKNNAIVHAVTFTVPGGNYNKIKFLAGRAQILSYRRQREDPLGLWEITWRPHASVLGADDDHSWEYAK